MKLEAIVVDACRTILEISPVLSLFVLIKMLLTIHELRCELADLHNDLDSRMDFRGAREIDMAREAMDR